MRKAYYKARFLRKKAREEKRKAFEKECKLESLIILY